MPDDRTDPVLKTFSLQTMHRQLQFHACGMFAFNYTLLFSLRLQDGKYSLVVTRTAKTITTCYLIFYTIVMVDAFTTSSNYAILNYYQTIVSNLGLIFELIGGVLLTYIIYGKTLIYHQAIKHIVTRLGGIDGTLKQFQRNLKYRYMFNYQCIHIVSGIGTLLVTAVAQYANATVSGFLMLTLSLRLVLMFPLLIIFVMETQYTCLAILIKFRYEFINKQLDVLHENNRAVVLAKFVNVVPISRGLASKSTEYASPSPVQRLDTLMTLHDALGDVVDDINDTFGLQVLISISLKFIISVFSIFYCYWSKAVKGRTWSSVFWFMWACYNLYELLNLSVSCQKAIAQARATGIHVHKILLNVSNAALKDKLTIFSQQLLHRQVRFTALELFTIDATLLLAIISAGSTYLIIMLQFQESTEGNKHTTIITNCTHSE